MSTMENTDTFSSTQVCALTGATYRMLDYWCRTGKVPGQEPTGTGHYRRFTPEHVIRVSKLVRASRLRNTPIDDLVELLDP